MWVVTAAATTRQKRKRGMRASHAALALEHFHIER
jgi:hypothetical protein